MLDVSLIRALDEAVGRRPLLEHPFYKAWAAGELTLDDLAVYSTQYWRQVEAFPGFLKSLAERVDDARVWEILVRNLRDEIDDDHASMWVDFAGAVGVERRDLERASIEPETGACIARFEGATSSAPIPFALGMLYGYESQTPAVAQTKVAGLRDHYGIVDGTRYFELHGEIDVEHAQELAVAVSAAVANEDDHVQAVEGAGTGASAIWTLLDGVARRRGITCAN